MNAEKILKNGWELHVALHCTRLVYIDMSIFGYAFFDLLHDLRKSKFKRYKFLRIARKHTFWEYVCKSYGH